MIVMAAADEAELLHMVATAAAHDEGPIAFRYPRGEGTGVDLPERGEPLEIGRGRILRKPPASPCFRLARVWRNASRRRKTCPAEALRPRSRTPVSPNRLIRRSSICSRENTSFFSRSRRIDRRIRIVRLQLPGGSGPSRHRLSSASPHASGSVSGARQAGAALCSCRPRCPCDRHEGARGPSTTLAKPLARHSLSSRAAGAPFRYAAKRALSA